MKDYSTVTKWEKSNRRWEFGGEIPVYMKLYNIIHNSKFKRKKEKRKTEI